MISLKLNEWKVSSNIGNATGTMGHSNNSCYLGTLHLEGQHQQEHSPHRQVPHQGGVNGTSNTSQVWTIYHICSPTIVLLYQHKLIKMCEELTSFKHCAVPFFEPRKEFHLIPPPAYTLHIVLSHITENFNVYVIINSPSI